MLAAVPTAALAALPAEIPVAVLRAIVALFLAAVLVAFQFWQKSLLQLKFPFCAQFAAVLQF